MQQTNTMIYPADFEQRIGFDRIRKMAENRCLTERAKEKVREITFSANIKQIETELSLADEMRSILMMEDGFPCDGLVDITSFLTRVKAEGAYLGREELALLREALTGTEQIIRFFNEKREKKYPFLTDMTKKIETFPAITAAIDRIIDKHAEIRDNASPELYDIRRAISSKEREASKRIQGILSQAKSAGIVEDEAGVSVRDGKTLIPVPAFNKKKIKGFVYDESSTGKTVYIEPLEVIEINNELRELGYAEGREIVRILTEFTDSIRPYADELIASGDFLSEIDLIMAKAKLALETGSVKPIVTNEPIINLRQARHPILEKALKKEGKPIVPLNLKLDGDKRILVISGPNAGGKSVCLKTTAIIQMMMQCGFLVPAAENSEITVFRKMFIDIGDQQSLDNDLSTYSSHLLNMRNILKYSDKHSLILIDEFGTGTEPSLGGAIAETILERIEEHGSFGVITTHYTNIKYYASSAKGVINGAMSFDVQNIKPLFELEIGKPGSSFAFEIARKIGLPEDVVKEAQGKIGEGQVNIERQLREIARDKNYWAKKREKIRQSEKRYDETLAEYETKLREIKEQKSVIIKQAKQEAEKLLADANRTIENTIREIKEAEAEKQKTKEVRAEFESFREEVRNFVPTEDEIRIENKIKKLKERELRKKEVKADKETSSATKNKPAAPKRSFEPGDTVKMKGQNTAGKVLSVEKNRVTVAFGQLTTATTKEKLEHISEPEYEKQSRERRNSMNSGMVTKSEAAGNYSTAEKRTAFTPEIDLRGARVDEALEKVRVFIDEAIMFGITDMRILHGKGTGALKEEIRKYLRTIPFVISAKDEHADFGGAGITVIKMDYN